MDYKKATKPKKKSQNEEIMDWIESQLRDSIDNTSAYAQKQERFYRLRMRLRDKKKSFPFDGASDLRQPTADIKIRKAKAATHNSIFGVRPIVQAIPGPNGDMQKANKIEKFMDHLLMDVMKVSSKALIAMDQTFEKGMYFMKPYWKTESTTRLETLKAEDFKVEEILMMCDPDVPDEMKHEALKMHLEVDMSDRVAVDNEEQIDKILEKIKNGETEINVTLWDEIYDAPDIGLISPEFLYVPTNSPHSIQDVEFMCHEFCLPLRQVKANKDKGWEVDNIEELKSYNSYDDRSLTSFLKDRREGIERLKKTNDVKVYEIRCWYDLNGDGYDEKCIFTYLPDFKKVVRKMSLPFKSGKWDIVKLVWEVLDDRFYASRGIVEIIEDIIKEIDIQHMQKLDQQTIRNNPMFMYRVGMVNPNLVKFQMNQAIPVKGTMDLKNVVDVVNANNPNVEMSYEREEQSLLGRIEELIGQMDFSLHNQINKRDARTLGEVNLQQQNMNTTFSMDAAVMNECFSDLFSMVFDLWCQYGKDEVEFAYFGADANTETIKLSREELQGYKIRLRANDQNTNPQVRIQKAQAVLQAAMNPIALQTGVVTPPQIVEAMKEYFSQLGIDHPERFINAQPQPMPQPGQGPQPINPKFSDLADGEQAQVLQKHGINFDSQGRALKKQAEMHDLMGAHRPKAGTNG